MLASSFFNLSSIKFYLLEGDFELRLFFLQEVMTGLRMNPFNFPTDGSLRETRNGNDYLPITENFSLISFLCDDGGEWLRDR